MKQIFRSKKFWTLVAAIVAALTAFFCSCTAMQKVTRHGVHCDTVRYEQIIKHKDFLSCLDSQTGMSSFVTGIPMRLFEPYIAPVPITSRTPSRFPFDSSSLAPSNYRMRSTPSTITNYPTFTAKPNNSSILTSTSSSSSQNNEFGTLCLVCMIPAAVVARHGGRKGRPRPRGTKTIPLGGSRL